MTLWCLFRGGGLA